MLKVTTMNINKTVLMLMTKYMHYSRRKYKKQIMNFLGLPGTVNNKKYLVLCKLSEWLVLLPLITLTEIT